MSLVRGAITPVLPPGETLFFEYNPTEFSTSKEVTWAEIGIPGMDFPLQQFVRGNLKTLDLDVYLNRDFYDTTHDVRGSIEAFERLVEKTAKLDAPPVCIFHWGKFDFVCVVGSLTIKYTMFDTDGEPIEATLSLALRQYKEKKQSFKLPPETAAQPLARKRAEPVFSGDLGSGSVLAHPDEGGPPEAEDLVERGETTTHVVEEGETYQSIAAEEYGDPNLWRVIEFANRGRSMADNIRAIASGERFIIPDIENAAGILEKTTGFPPEIRESLRFGRRGFSQAEHLIAAVNR
ncbi:MAG: hypothetical protein HYY16_03150 [Planctomycetes bacterium]|nr:hypothetical protein [Planctomycetota bacterium]